MPRIGIIEPISSGLSLIDAATARRADTVVFTADRDDRALPAAYRDRVGTIVVVDTNAETALIDAVVEAHRAVPFDALLPGFEYYVAATARAAARIGVPGLPVDGVDAVRDKSVMRSRLAASGLATPRFAAVTTPAELDGAARHVGFPAVLKPVDASGSMNVSRVDTLEEARRAYRAVEADERIDLGRRTSGRLQLESYVDGPEISIEGFVGRDGRPVILSITEKCLGPPPSFVETGHLVEAALSTAQRDAVETEMAKAVAALGITLGPFHGEMRLAADGPTVIEVAARLGGDRICDLVRLAKGVDLADAAIDCFLGTPPDVATPPSQGFAGIRFFLRPGLTVYGRAEGLDALAASPGYVEHHLTIGEGEPVPDAIDFRGRLGHAIFRAESHDELADRLSRADRLVRFT